MIGTVIKDQYRILELIGEGGMGSVYLALDIELERRVALKFLKAELGDNSVLIQRFRDELRTLAGFNHPNIATLFTSASFEGRPVMVMELVEGETLQKMVDRRGPIPAEVCVPLMNQALAGVSYAHRKKIVHRDLKPANLMRNLDGVVKVMDFGIAKIQNSPGLTRTNAVLGTSLYMAPEQIRGIPADARSDIYALGVTLYELLAGRVPFLGDSQYEIEHAHIQQQPDPPTVYYPHIPAAVVQAVMRALAKDPALRFQTADEFAAALSGNSIAQTIPEPRPKPAAQSAPAPAMAAAPALYRPETVPQTPVEHVPDIAPVQQREAVAHGTPAAKGRRGILVAVLAGTAVVLLAGGGFWLRSLSKPAATMYAVKSTGGGGGSAQLPPSGGSGGGGITPPSPVEPVSPAPQTPDTSSSLPPFELHPAQPKPNPPAAVTPKVAPKPVEARAVVPNPIGFGLAGLWTGSYDRCEDNRSTRVVMSLTEPAPGRVGGNLRYSAPDGSGTCSVDGVVVEQGKRLTLKAHCGGGAPAYFAPDRQSLLTFSGVELNGNVEPQEPCMTIMMKRSGR